MHYGVTMFPTDYAIQPAAVEAEIRLRSGQVPAGYLRGIGYRAFRWFVMTPYGGQPFLLRPAAARGFLEAIGSEVAGITMAIGQSSFLELSFDCKFR